MLYMKLVKNKQKYRDFLLSCFARNCQRPQHWVGANRGPRREPKLRPQPSCCSRAPTVVQQNCSDTRKDFFLALIVAFTLVLVFILTHTQLQWGLNSFAELQWNLIIQLKVYATEDFLLVLVLAFHTQIHIHIHTNIPSCCSGALLVVQNCSDTWYVASPHNHTRIHFHTHTIILTYSCW